MPAPAPAPAEGNRLSPLLGAGPCRRWPPSHPALQPASTLGRRAHGEELGQFPRLQRGTEGDPQSQLVSTGCKLDSKADIVLMLTATVNYFTNELFYFKAKY